MDDLVLRWCEIMRGLTTDDELLAQVNRIYADRMMELLPGIINLAKAEAWEEGFNAYRNSLETINPYMEC